MCHILEMKKYVTVQKYNTNSNKNNKEIKMQLYKIVFVVASLKWKQKLKFHMKLFVVARLAGPLFKRCPFQIIADFVVIIFRWSILRAGKERLWDAVSRWRFRDWRIA